MQNILGIHRSPSYSELVDKLLEDYKELGIRAVGRQIGLCFQIKPVSKHMRKVKDHLQQ
jgi:hypothetical protein